MPSFLAFLSGPRLYGLFHGPDRVETTLENAGNSALSFSSGIYYVVTSLAFSPMILFYMYTRGMVNPSSFMTILKYAGYLAVFSYGSRMVGRMMDDQYKQFLIIWTKANEGSKDDQKELKKYDFELTTVLPDYEATEGKTLWFLKPDVEEAGPITKALASFAINAFGRHMMYPGSLALLNYMMRQNLNQARKLMVRNKGGERIWIKNIEGDLVDAIFIRGENPQYRDLLVITCEGNAGYYEIGVANTPAQAGLSVLAWNQPGFGESSGLPFPKNTLSSADAVMQYATKVLKYPVEKIVLFGWSIGGFPVSWLAANYPNVRAVILDATFDDILPLAESRMPRFVSPIVEYAIRKHANLQIDKIITKYDGPLRLIRRLQEEILTTTEDVPENVRRASNRINFLLKAVLKERHPDLIKGMEPQVDRWLDMSETERLMNTGVTLREETQQRKRLFEACSHYLVDFDSNHVTPLDPLYFNIPDARKNF
ncbi:unnamed protein product [Caenorhabditis angaria]|uniref:AB hydrolase-1 domain-containing protein n=1 Tax=Caenorhabditis angaria TaxID=860376 RepID=A0A9P1N2U8_9PELO|nr:unnamed protein product [Caenorhabditis angaria]